MKIYTKKGDAGETGLFGGSRVPKDHLRIKTYGTLDELNSALGVALSGVLPASLKGELLRVQSELFQLGSELATPRGKDSGIHLISEKETKTLESSIDVMEKKLAPLKTFILPGGSPSASYLHLARTIARRAERELVVLNRQENIRAEILQYINRLSDYLFVAARFCNHEAKIADVPWVAPQAHKS